MSNHIISLFGFIFQVLWFTGSFNLKNIWKVNQRIGSYRIFLHGLQICFSIFYVSSNLYVLTNFNSVTVFRLLNFLVFTLTIGPIILATDLLLAPILQKLLINLKTFDEKYCPDCRYSLEKYILQSILVVNIVAGLILFWVEILYFNDPSQKWIGLVCKAIIRVKFVTWVLTMVLFEIFLMHIVDKNIGCLGDLIRDGVISKAEIFGSQIFVEVFYWLENIQRYFELNNISYLLIGFNAAVITITMIVIPKLFTLHFCYYVTLFPFLMTICYLCDALEKKVRS